MHATYIHTPTSTRDCRHRRPSFFDIFMAHGGDKICWESKLRCREKAKLFTAKCLLLQSGFEERQKRQKREKNKQMMKKEKKKKEERKKKKKKKSPPGVWVLSRIGNKVAE